MVSPDVHAPVVTAVSVNDPDRLSRLCLSAVLLLLLIGSLAVSDFDPSRLLEPASLGAANDFFHGFWPPRSDAEFLQRLWQGTLATVSMATVSTVLAMLLAAPVASLMCSRLSISARGRAMSTTGRALRTAASGSMLFLRSVPELIWALLFVSVTGLGATAGILGLMLTNIGILAKNYSEIIESGDASVSAHLLDNGNGRFKALLHGSLSQCGSELLSYTVYRWECTLRTSVVLGFVGAGGLGQELMISIRQLAAPEVFSIILVFILLVWLADALSARLRHRLLASQQSVSDSAAGGLWRLCQWLPVLAGVLACFWYIDWHLADWLQPGRLERVSEFLAGFLPPDFSASLWQRLAGDALETLAMAFAGTALASILGLALSYLAFSLSLRGSRSVAAILSRLLQLLQIVLRSIPELVWAMLLIILVGIGPFSGTLALCLCSLGVLSRLYSECLDNQDAEPLQNLLGNGARWSLAPMWTTLVQARSQLISYTLYRWEHNLRAATLMGIVGAGGVGQELYLRLSVFQFDRVAACVLVILAMVAMADKLSHFLRHRYAATF